VVTARIRFGVGLAACGLAVGLPFVVPVAALAIDGVNARQRLWALNDKALGESTGLGHMTDSLLSAAGRSELLGVVHEIQQGTKQHAPPVK
jgi:hypothetical protein